MEEMIKQRTKKLAINIIRLCSTLPNKQEFWVISRQLIRAATSVGANYRAVCRAKSTPDFINKLAIVEEEADESIYWLELLEELDIKNDVLSHSKKEMNEILSIVIASKKTAKRKMQG